MKSIHLPLRLIMASFLNCLLVWSWHHSRFFSWLWVIAKSCLFWMYIISLYPFPLFLYGNYLFVCKAITYFNLYSLFFLCYLLDGHLLYVWASLFLPDSLLLLWIISFINGMFLTQKNPITTSTPFPNNITTFHFHTYPAIICHSYPNSKIFFFGNWETLRWRIWRHRIRQKNLL